MLRLNSLSLLGILLHHYFFSSTSALPLETHRQLSLTLSKRTVEFLDCPGPLPLPPYPEAPIFMKATHIDVESQAPTALTYTDRWGEQEYIFEREGLCSRAGCKCVSGSIVCNNFGYLFFSRVLHSWYSADCLATCSCSFVDPHNPPSVSLTGGGKNVSVDLIASLGSGTVNIASTD
ncbi:hypothetical protein HO173_002230 [Letharia columbiana]|uniref:Uncharacterized protein n=1 Tax=Letharia columbiana TaxID=112416 RepID=A0A8H6G3F7_9LECA|nr:uncharacterized protein HO173_002230 [Letharia columbiana]KAF6239684.1 hypothetical protein HO173_002230 [Letharia columbiana]